MGTDGHEKGGHKSLPEFDGTLPHLEYWPNLEIIDQDLLQHSMDWLDGEGHDVPPLSPPGHAQTAQQHGLDPTAHPVPIVNPNAGQPWAQPTAQALSGNPGAQTTSTSLLGAPIQGLNPLAMIQPDVSCWLLLPIARFYFTMLTKLLPHID